MNLTFLPSNRKGFKIGYFFGLNEETEIDKNFKGVKEFIWNYLDSHESLLFQDLDII